MKNILVVDDSALMRKVICDIISSHDNYCVEDIAKDGMAAYEILQKKSYDAIILDLLMPRMTGLELLEALKRDHIEAKIIVVSTLAVDGADETIRALELGAVDFVTKPGNFIEARGEDFRCSLKKALETVFAMSSEQPVIHVKQPRPALRSTSVRNSRGGANKIIALACSTGGPKSLQNVIPLLPENLNAAILLVQHMPMGFTATLASRLNDLSKITVKEAEDGEDIKKGVVYIAPGGKHLTCKKVGASHVIKLNDDPPRNALKPCANIMYDSLINSGYDEIVCVVLTGMGADGTEGIVNLNKKKPLYVIAQDAASCVVYGMPKAIAETGLVNEIVPLDTVAQSITKYVGVY